jgi:hypothetical protein
MYISSDEQAVISKEIWRVWARKDRLREEAAARRTKMVTAGIVLLAIGSCVYFLAIR